LVYDFTKDGLTVTDAVGSRTAYARVRGEELSPRPLAGDAGTYVSDEAETTLIAGVDGDVLVLKRRPDTVIRLTPVYADAFRGSIGFVRFHRDASGQILSLSVTQDRCGRCGFNETVGSRKSGIESHSPESESAVVSPSRKSQS
jgi:hypothetical protein